MHIGSFRGYITAIETLQENKEDCTLMVTLTNDQRNVVNFIVAWDTYIVDHVTLYVGAVATGFYDLDAPAVLIYPPQYKALAIALDSPWYQVKMDVFDQRLLSADQRLQLVVVPETRIVMMNNQVYNGNLGDNILIVIYTRSTRSLPAITTPIIIVVMCHLKQ